jgi:hypothetical protein
MPSPNVHWFGEKSAFLSLSASLIICRPIAIAQIGSSALLYHDTPHGLVVDVALELVKTE